FSVADASRSRPGIASIVSITTGIFVRCSIRSSTVSAFLMASAVKSPPRSRISAAPSCGTARAAKATRGIANLARCLNMEIESLPVEESVCLTRRHRGLITQSITPACRLLVFRSLACRGWSVFAAAARFSLYAGIWHQFAGAMSRSECCDIVEPGDGNDLGTADQDPCPVAPDAESNGIMDIDLTRGRTVAEIVEVGIMKLQKLDLVQSEVTKTR